MAASSAYQPLSSDAEGALSREAPPGRQQSRLQWLVLFALTMTAGVVLGQKIAMRQQASGAAASMGLGNGTAMGQRRRRNKRWNYPMSMGRMGVSSS